MNEKTGMNFRELNQTINLLRNQGFDDKDILELIFNMFKEGKMPLEDMKKIAASLGYELTDKFLEAVKQSDQ